MLPIETIAIVEATAPDVRAQAAAITFRMWHDLPSEAARRLLLAEFALGGRVVGLLDAIMGAVRHDWQHPLPRLLTPAEAQSSPPIYAAIEPALLRALTDVLGARATSAVLNAWKQAFRFLTGQLAV